MQCKQKRWHVEPSISISSTASYDYEQKQTVKFN